MADGASTIKKGRKYDQVVEGARKVFLTDGFEGASVDDIARTAGVSKATLYSYFPDKRLLFMEVATAECEAQADKALEFINTENPPREVLTIAAERMLGFFLSDFGQRVFRICVAETDRFPELGAKFYESGPCRVRGILQTYFAEAIARGELKIEDPLLAADQFAELCKADLFPKLVFGIKTKFSDAEVARISRGAVDTFLARYGC